MNIRTQIKLDKPGFFQWLNSQEMRWELVKGVPVMLPNVSRNHARICNLLINALNQRLDLDRYNVTQGDFAVETGGDSVRYADIMVEPFGADGAAHSTQAALFLAEVLSPSTMHIDFHQKLGEYLALPDLGTYIICAQDARRLWVWTRENGGWPDLPVIIEESGAAINIPVLNISINVDEIYRGIGIA